MITGVITQARATVGTFRVVILEVSGENPGGGINTPPIVRALLYASATPLGSNSPPMDRNPPEGDVEEETMAGS